MPGTVVPLAMFSYSLMEKSTFLTASKTGNTTTATTRTQLRNSRHHRTRITNHDHTKIKHILTYSGIRCMTTSAFCIASLVVIGGNRVKQFREAENSIRFNSTATNSKFELHSLIYHDLYAAAHSRCTLSILPPRVFFSLTSASMKGPKAETLSQPPSPFRGFLMFDRQLLVTITTIPCINYAKD